MDNKNTLQITAQYPAERYNLLVPMQTVAEIAEIHKPVMNAVQISTNEADKEIYLQDRSKAKADGWALTKKGLNKLMRAAGIKILGTRPIIPSTCQKCAEVNKSIGRPVNCGTCGKKDVKFEARISVPQLTGENIEIVAHKEIIVDDVSVGMTEFQKKEFLKFRSEMCETKAINRALRAAMHIKGTYSLAELSKPFVVAYLVPNLDNEAVKAEAVRHFFTSAQELYGGHNTEARRAIFVEDDVEEGMEYETPGKPIEQLMSSVSHGVVRPLNGNESVDDAACEKRARQPYTVLLDKREAPFSPLSAQIGQDAQIQKLSARDDL